MRAKYNEHRQLAPAHFYHIAHYCWKAIVSVLPGKHSLWLQLCLICYQDFSLAALSLQFIVLAYYIIPEFVLSSPGSSVDRVLAWKAECRGFESHPGELFFFLEEKELSWV